MKIILLVAMTMIGTGASAAQKEVEVYMDGESSKIAITIRGAAAKSIYDLLSVTPVRERGSFEKYWKYGKSVYCVQNEVIWDAPSTYECYQLVD